MKSYWEWKERGAYGTWKYGENLDADKLAPQKSSEAPRKSSEVPIRHSLSRMSSGVSLESFTSDYIGLFPTDMVCDISL